tara:strand:+ start:3823 stop:4056 length:234 start_codon:yes stop_codon:yes gene_type:complete
LNQPSKFLDLKNIPCPLNVVKCKLALEKQSNKDILQIELDKGEPEEMVTKTLISMGYKIKVIFEDQDWIRLSIVHEC